MKMNCRLFLAAMLLGACSVIAGPDDIIDIHKTNTYVVPISISGFEGEVQSVLAFDLSVLGMEVTSPDKAAYLVSGSQNGRIQGSLTATGTEHALWARAYAGGLVRAQTHAFANDIVKEIRGAAPIFQTRIAFRLQKGSATEIAVA